MIVAQLDNNSIYTLCCQVDGDIRPIADFSDKSQAEYLQKEINKQNCVVMLDELSDVREFCIGVKRGAVIETTARATNLSEALNILGINVDFEVEPKEKIVPELFEPY